MSSLRSLCFIGYIYLISFSSYNTKVTYHQVMCDDHYCCYQKQKNNGEVPPPFWWDKYILMYISIFFWTNKREKAIKNLLIPTCSLGCSLPVAHPFICRKNLLLKTKLFSVRINVSSVVMTIVAMLFVCALLRVSLTAFMPSSFGILGIEWWYIHCI